MIGFDSSEKLYTDAGEKIEIVDPFSPSQVYDEFLDAKIHAQYTAVKYKSTVTIRRLDEGWVLDIPQNIFDELALDFENHIEYERSLREEQFELSCAPDPRWRSDDSIRDEPDSTDSYSSDFEDDPD